MMELLPNQSGTFGNRVNFHDASTNNQEKIFAIEFHTDDIELRKEIVAKIRAMDDVLEALQDMIYEEANCYEHTFAVINKAQAAITKALTI